MIEFKSKIGYEMLIPIILMLGFPVVWSIIQGESSKSTIVLCLIILPIIAFILDMFLRTKYLITDENKLQIRCGLFYNSEIDIMRIKSIKKTRSPIASPAPSFDRIELSYGKYDFILISPKNKVSFANEMLKINPKIENQL